MSRWFRVHLWVVVLLSRWRWIGVVCIVLLFCKQLRNVLQCRSSYIPDQWLGNLSWPLIPIVRRFATSLAGLVWVMVVILVVPYSLLWCDSVVLLTSVCRTTCADVDCCVMTDGVLSLVLISNVESSVDSRHCRRRILSARAGNASASANTLGWCCWFLKPVISSVQSQIVWFSLPQIESVSKSLSMNLFVGNFNCYIMCVRRFASVAVSSVWVLKNSNKSLLTSGEHVARSSIVMVLTSVIPVMVLYRFQVSLNSSHSFSSMFAFTVGLSGVLVFVFVFLAFLSSAFSMWRVCSCSICCCISVSIDAICCSVAIFVLVRSRTSRSDTLFTVFLFVCGTIVWPRLLFEEAWEDGIDGTSWFRCGFF